LNFGISCAGDTAQFIVSASDHYGVVALLVGARYLSQS
jgi:hypothetical protein